MANVEPDRCAYCGYSAGHSERCKARPLDYHPSMYARRALREAGWRIVRTFVLCPTRRDYQITE